MPRHQDFPLQPGSLTMPTSLPNSLVMDVDNPPELDHEGNEEESVKDLHAIFSLEHEKYFPVYVSKEVLFPPVTNHGRQPGDWSNDIAVLHDASIDGFHFQYAYAFNLNEFNYKATLLDINKFYVSRKRLDTEKLQNHVSIVKEYMDKPKQGRLGPLASFRDAISWDFEKNQPIQISLNVSRAPLLHAIKTQRSGLCNIMQMTTMMTYPMSDGTSFKGVLLHMTDKNVLETEQRKEQRINLLKEMYKVHDHRTNMIFPNIPKNLTNGYKFESFVRELASMRY